MQKIGRLVADVTETKALQVRQGVLVAELQHRTRNIMGVVRPTADKTMRRSLDLADFHDRYNVRLAALSRVQSLLSHLAEGERITFDDLIQSEVAAMNGEVERITLNGPKGVPCDPPPFKHSPWRCMSLPPTRQNTGLLRNPKRGCT